jgi:hypothetical protein
MAGSGTQSTVSEAPARLIVRFSTPAPGDAYDARRAEAFYVERFGDADQARWRALRERLPGFGMRPLFGIAPADRIIERFIQYRRRQDQRSDPLLRYFEVAVADGADLLAARDALAELEAIEVAYIDRPGPDPVVAASDDPLRAAQQYLDPAPVGVDAQAAWDVDGGSGLGVQVVDLERGWTLTHEDLADHAIQQLPGGTIRDASRAHGTRALGVVCAVDNQRGCVGVAPKAQPAVVSYHGTSRPDAILSALFHLRPGDVLLIEAQVWGPYGSDYEDRLLPVEIYPADWELIRLATDIGIVVVEAGGNGDGVDDGEDSGDDGVDFDVYEAGEGRVLNSTSPDFRDSGALIVTAARSSTPHARLSFAPSGARIDCYAWGEDVFTTDSSESGATDLYTEGERFGGTSSAAAIIAGVVTVMQGIALKRTGHGMGAEEIRALLRDRDLGTGIAPWEEREIGWMPDLAKIVARLTS